MSNEQLPSASSANGGFRVGALTPEEAERFAALFVPAWESASEVPAGPDPGFKSAKIGLDVGSFMADAGAPSVNAPDPKRDAKKTMIGIVAADVPPPPALETAPAAPPAADAAPAAKPGGAKATMIGLAAPAPQASADAPLKATMVELAPAKAAPIPPTPLEIATTVDAPAAPAAPVFAPTPVVASSSTYDADDVGLPSKRSRVPYVLGGVAVVAIIGILVATRGGEKAPPKDEPKTITESKSLALPDPNQVGTPATTAAATATTAAPTETAAAKTAEPVKTAEPTKTAEPVVTAKAPPPPPPAKTVAAPKPPPAKTVAAPKPPPVKTAPKPPAPKKPAVKEEF